MNSERIFQQDQQWYFRIRGNSVKGPFMSYPDAEAGLRRFVRARTPAPAMLRWLKPRSRAQRLGNGVTPGTAGTG
jgi:hypothetical protein